MKRYLFYFVLLIQVLLIILLVVQNGLIDRYGKTVKLITEKNDYIDNSFYEEDFYTEYEINKISKDQWKLAQAEDLAFNERVYVLLKEDEDGIYHVVEATDEQMTAEENEVVLIGMHPYYDSGYHVDYGIETIKNYKQYGSLDPNKQWLVTLKVSPWHQKKIIAIENVNE